MKTLGTIDEWIKHKPEAFITNRSFLQKGAAIHGFKRNKMLVESTYPSSHPDGQPMIYFGNQCPYIQKGKFRYTASSIYWPAGCGGGVVLSDDQADDPNWFEYDCKDYEGEK